MATSRSRSARCISASSAVTRSRSSPASHGGISPVVSCMITLRQRLVSGRWCDARNKRSNIPGQQLRTCPTNDRMYSSVKVRKREESVRTLVPRLLSAALLKTSATYLRLLFATHDWSFGRKKRRVPRRPLTLWGMPHPSQKGSHNSCPTL